MAQCGSREDSHEGDAARSGRSDDASRAGAVPSQFHATRPAAGRAAGGGRRRRPGTGRRHIAKRLGRSPRFVDQWLARYRKGGLEAIRPGKAKGQKPKLPAEKQAAFKARILAGPTEADGGVCTLRGAEARRILSREFGVEMCLSGVYELMHRLNLSCLRPRPLHRKNDPRAVADWLERAPLLPRN